MVFDIDKMKAVLLYVTKKAESVSKSDLLTVFKVLYFADQKHLAKYGRPIIDDHYIAMKHGPVPSIIYDWFKVIRGDGFRVPAFENIYHCFELKDGKTIVSKTEPDLGEISKSELDCLNASFEENHHLDFTTLSDKSHDAAWNNANTNDMMDILDIAKAGGATDEMIKFIETHLDRKHFQLH